MKKLFLLLISLMLLFEGINSNLVQVNAKTWSSVKEYQEYALANYSKPMKAKWNNPIPGAKFGASRDNGRLHAGTDFFVPNGNGTIIYAMTSGTVKEVTNVKYWNYFIGIQNDDGSWLRYCEISPSVKVGDKVKQGQQIGKIIPNTYPGNGGTMLHLEAYLGTTSGSLSNTSNKTYKYVSGTGYGKRSDLIDSGFLLNVKKEVNGSPSTPTPTTGCANYPILKKGSTGNNVKILQQWLNKVNNAGLAEDGSFGPATDTAVRNYQRKKGLVVDGSVGPNTWCALEKDYKNATTPKYTVNVEVDQNYSGCVNVVHSAVVGEKYGSLLSWTPTRTGYTFIGWFTAKSGGSQVTKDTIITNRSNHSIYAQWRENTYTIQMNGNGGSGNPSNIYAKFGTVVNLPSKPFTKTGYNFKGWNLRRDSDGKFFVGGIGWLSESEIVNKGYSKQVYIDKLSMTLDNSWFTQYTGGSTSFTFIAVWSLKKYTINYYANGGSGAPGKQTKSHNVTLKLSTKKPTRKGYTFLGWSTSSSAKSATYKAGAKYTKNSGSNLYAVWKKNTVKPTATPSAVNTKIKLNKTTATIGTKKVGKYTNTLQLKATVTGNSNTKVTWTSSNPKIAKVDKNGKVTGVSDPKHTVSTVTITAKTADGKTAKCKVTVEDPINAFVRRLYKYCFNRKPDKNGFNSWTSQLRNKKIDAAQVIEGFFNSKEMKNLKLSSSGIVDRCYLVMMDRKSDKNGKTYWVNNYSKYGKKYVLKGFVESKEFTKICKDYNIKRGSIKLDDKKTTSSTKKPTSNTKISLNKKSATIGTKSVGKYKNTVQLSATVTGNSNKKVTWKSSNTKIATVDSNGLVKGVSDPNVSATTVTITAKTSDGKTSTCKVKVEDPVSAFVRRLYKSCLGRNPDSGGFKYWTSKLNKKEITAASAVEGFFFSKEMENKKLTNSQFVEKCYSVLLNRKSDTNGKKYWLNKISNGMSRKEVLKNFVESKEFTKICSDYNITRGSIYINNYTSVQIPSIIQVDSDIYQEMNHTEHRFTFDKNGSFTYYAIPYATDFFQWMSGKYTVIKNGEVLAILCSINKIKTVSNTENSIINYDESPRTYTLFKIGNKWISKEFYKSMEFPVKPEYAIDSQSLIVPKNSQNITVQAKINSIPLSNGNSELWSFSSNIKNNSRFGSFRPQLNVATKDNKNYEFSIQWGDGAAKGAYYYFKGTLNNGILKYTSYIEEDYEYNETTRKVVYTKSTKYNKGYFVVLGYGDNQNIYWVDNTNGEIITFIGSPLN